MAEPDLTKTGGKSGGKAVDTAQIAEKAIKEAEKLTVQEAGEFVKEEATLVADRVNKVVGFFELSQEQQIKFLVGVLQENQALKDKVDSLYIDATTGLHVKKFYEETAKMMIGKELRLAQASERLATETDLDMPHTEVSLVLIDLDHFKKINDTYGHQAGDFVLGEIGKMINNVFRMSDIKGRYGGEEMVIVLPNCNEEDARKRAEDLRVQLKEKPLLFKDNIGEEIEIPVTLSAGVSTLDLTKASNKTMDADEILKTLVASADKNLYNAKNFGRNRVVVSKVDLPAATATATESTSGEPTGESASTTPRA